MSHRKFPQGMCHSVPAQFRSCYCLEINEPRLFVGPRPLRHETIGQSVKTYSMMQLVSVRDQLYSLGGGWFRGFGGSHGFQREQRGGQSFQTELKKETLGNWLPMRGDQWPLTPPPPSPGDKKKFDPSPTLTKELNLLVGFVSYLNHRRCSESDHQNMKR